MGAHSDISDEGNALEPASVWEAHHIQILYLPTEAPILTNGIHLQNMSISTKIRHVGYILLSKSVAQHQHSYL